jgi:NADPH:quinone reductase-like Zn-dependent oxidoreductase
VGSQILRAIRIHEHGGRDRLVLENVPRPEALPGQVRVRLHAAGLNHLDLWVRRGIPGVRYPLPITPGCDGAGVILECGSPLQGFAAGDRVALAPGVSCGLCEACLSGRDNLCRDYGILGEHRDGTCAEEIVLPGRNLIPIPDGISFEEAAAVPLVFLTAWEMVVEKGRVRPGETVVVLGAGSGVGTAAIQVARLHSARVIAVSGSAEKLQRARELGAEEGIDLSRSDLREEVRRLTGKRGADLVIEHVGNATWEQSVASVARGGRLVTCGATSGADVNLNLRQVFFKNVSILGSTMGSRAHLFPIFRHLQARSLRAVVDRVLPMDRIQEAHRLLEEREIFGKILITLSPADAPS